MIVFNLNNISPLKNNYPYKEHANSFKKNITNLKKNGVLPPIFKSIYLKIYLPLFLFSIHIYLMYFPICNITTTTLNAITHR